MSGHMGAQPRALPFTGLTTLPLILVGLVLSALGALMTLVRPKSDVA
jgi:hypothetical protein